MSFKATNRDGAETIENHEGGRRYASACAIKAAACVAKIKGSG